ncbi:MAG: cysteine desulfurase family protein [Ilumatobacteraceae bacterium]
MERLLYLDHAASTPMRPAAVEAMTPFLTDCFANPSGSHRFARTARRAVDEAREQVADVLGVLPGEVVFTGCGTESDNQAVTGSVAGRPGVAVTSAAEHHAVLDPVVASGGVVVGVDSTGHIDLDGLTEALRAAGEVAVVSVMAVNNEVGTVTDLEAVAAVVRREAPGAWLHTDAVQAACWLDLRTVTPLVDMVSLSAHKFGGPKGVGVLVVRGSASPAPIIRGGGQERERRSGTSNVAGIVATAAALGETDAERATEVERVGALRSRLVETVVAEVDARETVPAAASVPGVAHLCFEGVENEALLFLLDTEGVCASAASACASGAMEPSHVLAAMGVSRELAGGALRLSFGHTSTVDEIDAASAAVVSSVRRLRGES